MQLLHPYTFIPTSTVIREMRVCTLKRSLVVFGIKLYPRILSIPWLDPWWGWWNYRHHHLEQLQLCPKSKLDLDCLLQQWNPRHKNWLQIYVYIPSYLLEDILISYFSLKTFEERIIIILTCSNRSNSFFCKIIFSKGLWKQTVKTTPNIVYVSKWWGHDFVSLQGLMYILFQTMPKIIEKYMLYMY